MSDTDKPDPKRDAGYLRFLNSIFFDEPSISSDEADPEWEAMAVEVARIEKLSAEELRRELEAQGVDSATAGGGKEWGVEELLERAARRAQERAKARSESGEKK